MGTNQNIIWLDIKVHIAHVVKLLQGWNQIQTKLCRALDTAVSSACWEVTDDFQGVPY